MKLDFLLIFTFLIVTDIQARKPRKWRPPLEYGPRTTSIYTSLQRSNRRKINVDLLDIYDDRTKAPRPKLGGSSYKPGTWNWYPNMSRPAYSYRFKVINITREELQSYKGMNDYRNNYGPLDYVKFGGTFAPIPPLLGDPRQPRLAWYLKKYTPPPPPRSYIQHIMDTIKEGRIKDRWFEKQVDPEAKYRVSAEWYTVRPRNMSNYWYEDVKVKPRFGDHGSVRLKEPFPTYNPPNPEVVMVPQRQAIHKRSAELDSKERAAKKSKNKKLESYSSNSYTYEQFDSNDSIPVPFTAEEQFQSSEDSSKVLSKRSAPSAGSTYEEVPDPYSKSDSFPQPLNTGESGWGAKPPASKSTESGSDSSGIGNNTGYPDRPYPRMRPDDNETQRESSGLENESFPSAVDTASSDLTMWEAVANYSSEFKTVSQDSQYDMDVPDINMTSSGDTISSYSYDFSKRFGHRKKGKTDEKSTDKKAKSGKKAEKSTKDKAQRGKIAMNKNKKTNNGNSGRKSVSKKLKKNMKKPLEKNRRKLNFGSDEAISNPWGEISYVSEVTVDPPGIRTYPPTFVDEYVAPLHYQPDSFWDEIYRPDGPDPTLLPYQQEEWDKEHGTTTWIPPVVTTRDPKAKPRYIYVTNEETVQEDSLLASSALKDEKSPKKFHRAKKLTKKQMQLKKIMELKARNRRNHIDNANDAIVAKDKDKGNKEKKKPKKKDKEKKNNANNFSRPNPDHLKVQGRTENDKDAMIAKGKDKGKKEKKKPKKKDKEKKYNPNNFSRPNPDHLKVAGHSDTKSEIGDQIHGDSKEKNRIGGPMRKVRKGKKVVDAPFNIHNEVHKIEEPGQHLEDPQLYMAVTPFEPDYSFSEPRPDGNYEWPSFRNPNFNPETAYDEDGFPVHESPSWTSPTTHRKDRIFGREKKKLASGVKGRGILMAKYLKEVQAKNAGSHSLLEHNDANMKEHAQDLGLHPVLPEHMEDKKIKIDLLHLPVNGKNAKDSKTVHDDVGHGYLQHDLNHQAVNTFQVHKDEQLNTLLKDDQHQIHGMDMQKQDLARAKRKVRNKEDFAINPALYGNQNLFSVNRKPLVEKNNLKKEDEALNPLLYGNQNLFSANHKDYIKLSDIHSPFAEPPYGIPIDGEIKNYNEGYEAPSKWLGGITNSLYSRPQTINEKLALLRILKAERDKVRAQRASARLSAPIPMKMEHPKDHKYNAEEEEHKHLIHKRNAEIHKAVIMKPNVDDHRHIVNKRNTWEAERLHPMLYGQKVIVKPKDGKPYFSSALKEIHWMSYVNMQQTRIITSNPRQARKRLWEYKKLIGRERNVKEVLRQRNERRRREGLNTMILPKERHLEKKFRDTLKRHGIIPNDPTKKPELRAEDMTLRIQNRDEMEGSWMPYVQMNHAMIKAMKKENHKNHKYDDNFAIGHRIDKRSANTLMN